SHPADHGGGGARERHRGRGRVRSEAGARADLRVEESVDGSASGGPRGGGRTDARQSERRLRGAGGGCLSAVRGIAEGGGSLRLRRPAPVAGRSAPGAPRSARGDLATLALRDDRRVPGYERSAARDG